MIGHGRYRSLGASDGGRARPTQLLPNLGSMPFTSQQKAALDARARAVHSAPPWIHPALSLFAWASALSLMLFN